MLCCFTPLTLVRPQTSVNYWQFSSRCKLIKLHEYSHTPQPNVYSNFKFTYIFAGRYALLVVFEIHTMQGVFRLSYLDNHLRFNKPLWELNFTICIIDLCT